MRRTRKSLELACFMTLIGLALFVWSVLDPAPIPIMAALSVGQVIGTLASVIFLFAVIADVRRMK